MALLRTEPSGPVRTLRELFALAYELEQAAAQRYDEFAERMRMQGNAPLAELFAHLAAEERGHVESVVHWAERQEGAPPDPAQAPWRPPETMDAEGTDAVEPRLLTPYRALSVAVRNEERAFVFWSYVAAHGETAEVRRAAEGMASAELEHVALLRRQRRRAYHAAREADQPIPETAALERQLADALDRVAARTVGETAGRLMEFATEARAVAEELEAAEPQASPASQSAESPDASASGDPAVLAELLVDRYLEAADGAQDEARVVRAQWLAGSAIARLIWLRSNPPTPDP